MGTQIFDSQIKDSIALTGTPTAPTPSVSDDSTRIATTEFIKNQVASDTVKGMVELATSAEVLAGVDTERGITPATLTAKILGTVSQGGGVPTGAIIERGSNANGEYTKFADGTMICQGVYSTINPVTTTVSTWYESTLGNTPVYYSSTFINSPAVSCSGWIVAGIGTGQVHVIERGQTYCECVLRSANNIGSDKTKIFSYLAIGRWF